MTPLQARQFLEDIKPVRGYINDKPLDKQKTVLLHMVNYISKRKGFNHRYQQWEIDVISPQKIEKITNQYLKF